MPEERKVTGSNLPPVEDGQQNLAEHSDDDRRAAHIQRVILIGSVLSIITIASYALLYAQTGMWQVLADGGGFVLALVCMALAYWSVRRGKLDTAAYWLLLALVAAYGASELVWADETVLNVIGGVSLIFLVGNIVLRRKWRGWLVTSGLYLALILLINQFTPLPRHDAITEVSTLYYFDLGLTILLVTTSLWLIFRALRTSTIRSRLLVAFIVVALLPATIISIGTIMGEIQNNRQTIFNQLELMAALKEAEIDAWIHALQTDLSTALIGKDATRYAHALLQRSPDAASYQDDHDMLQSYFRLLIEQTQRFEEMFLMDTNGTVILSTNDTQEGQSHSYQIYFQRGLRGEPYVHSPSYSPALGLMPIIAVHPVVDEQGQVLGVLAGRSSQTALSNIIRKRAGSSESEQTYFYLVSASYTLLTTSRSGETEGTEINTIGSNAAIENHINGFDLYQDHRMMPVIGVYHWLPELQVALLVEQE
ncbi:MAG: hypothetical protein V3S14_12450, partial [Anaerolineae bacterium]